MMAGPAGLLCCAGLSLPKEPAPSLLQTPAAVRTTFSATPVRKR